MSQFKLISFVLFVGVLNSNNLFSKDWRYHTVAWDGDLGEHCSIAIDIDSYTYISYYSFTGTYRRCLVLSYQDQSGWHTEKVDECRASFSSIKIDSQNNPCISYIVGIRHPSPYRPHWVMA